LSHDFESKIGETEEKQDKAKEKGVAGLGFFVGTLANSCVKVGRSQIFDS